MRRALLVLAALLPAVVVVAGCGEDPPPRPRPPVGLTLSAPADGSTTRELTVVVAGSVAPANARVIVRGEVATVSGGAFSHSVALDEGANVIDVGASAAGRRAVWRALRVTRSSKVRMPVLVGQQQDAARSVLEGLGLEVDVVNDDDLIDAFRGGPRLVCSTDPDAGSQVDAGAEVEIVVSRTC